MGIGMKDGHLLKRLSNRVAEKLQVKRLSQSKRVPSDLDESRGNIKESNALNEQGVMMVDRIGEEIQSWIEDVDELNENDPFIKDGNTPQIKISAYIGRLARYCNILTGQRGGKETAGIRSAVICVMYMDRLRETGFIINRLNVHRIIQAGVLIALKFEEDRPISSDYWAKVAGIEKGEVNQLESAFCNLIKFELFVNENSYNSCLDQFDLPEF